MSQPILISAKTARTFLGVGDVTLWRWRTSGIGPRWCKMGARIKYELSSVNEYIEQRLQERSSTAPLTETAT
ncbi:MAG: helix-turn-helix transcriptional regulator [Gemmatimonas sp.]|jgi:predicted DNA-binding transcriptional regulator AlpA|uniref:helix-turn-helix transcriptional regulator n=1 Tax=Gemmatimonas sp. TaxID=1962908 RepID=UPI0022C469E8|nr:helix-turn-helix domain-containing protein [Gemmatimonas sp.]MCZ8012026.1 hypothetical protein [Gemmatimonas sp.]MCZ8267346.1 hypothetical protein [Gemmatimonas sp.]